MAIVFLFSAAFLCIRYLEKKKDCPHQKPLLHLTQEHKGSKSYSHMPLQGPPENKTRQKCHNSGSIKTSHFTGHPIQPAPHPQSRHQTGFGHTNRTGLSMWLYKPAAQFLLLSLSQSLTAQLCGSLSSTTLPKHRTASEGHCSHHN